MSKLYLVLLMGVFLVSIVDASSIYTDQMNFEPGSSRTHGQTIQLDASADLVVVSDPNFNLTWSSPAATTAGNNLTWSSVSSVEFNLTSPSNCTEGDVYRMPVYTDGSIFSSFTFICTPDSKVIDYKGEYGHGDSNYLNTVQYPYVPANTDFSLFNLIRVYTYGSYLNPNEEGLNATVQCTFPKYLVLTRQKNQGTNIIHNDDSIEANFYWTSLFGNWFRIAPLEQEVNSLSVGDFYNVTCDEVTYQYSTGQIRASMDPISLEARNTSALTVTATTDFDYDGVIYTITNSEKYPIYNLELKWLTDTNDLFLVDSVQTLDPNETVKWEVFVNGQGTLNLDASYIPVWQKSSLKPLRYSQDFSTNFNFSSANSSIDRIIPSLSSYSFNLEITEQEQLARGDTYEAYVTMTDGSWAPIIPDAGPRITLRDVDGNTIVENVSMTLIRDGVYKYLYTISAFANVGIWTTEVTVDKDGEQGTVYDRWTLVSNPTKVEVEVDEVCGIEVCGVIKITNEGISPYEYIYHWWTTDTPGGDYEDAYDMGQASKLIQPGETYEARYCLDRLDDTDTLPHYFRARTYYGAYSYATDTYTDDELNCGLGTRVAGIVGAIGRADLPVGGLGFLLVLILFIIYICIQKKRKEDQEVARQEAQVEQQERNTLNYPNYPQYTTTRRYE